MQSTANTSRNAPPLIVAIDGPAGSGKSTTARAVAQQLGYVYLDTGAMYRARALAYLRIGGDPVELARSGEARDAPVEVSYTGGDMRVLLGGEDVTDHIRTPEVGVAASRISTVASVREALVDAQRRIALEQVAKGRGVVLDGRDIGTVVFPDADVKIFMRADPAARARRRHAELRARGVESSIEEVLAEIQERDRLDAVRAIAPLRKAEDAVEIDTTACGIEEQVAFTVRKVRERLEKTSVKNRSR